MIKPEPFLAELNRMRQDIGKDESDPEWLAVHHAFCFLSYKMSDFTAYLAQAEARGEFDAYKAQRDED